jgi:hypothetical protein
MTLSSLELAATGAGAIFSKLDGPLIIPFEQTGSGLVVIMYQDMMLYRRGPREECALEQTVSITSPCNEHKIQGNLCEIQLK